MTAERVPTRSNQRGRNSNTTISVVTALTGPSLLHTWSSSNGVIDPFLPGIAAPTDTVQKIALRHEDALLAAASLTRYRTKIAMECSAFHSDRYTLTRKGIRVYR
ncbi:unnamed protein product [Anisakis simplex]|uniref:Transposase n=1 Tax=Anisakis simplex TaxID=6269 RepID=A0A0M3JUH2_ANISI|nr:unnamed protein product [Anisakis simplex]